MHVILLHRVRCNNLRSFFFVSSACARVWLLFNGLFALLCVFLSTFLDMCVGFDLAKVIKKSTSILAITAFIFIHRTFLNHA